MAAKYFKPLPKMSARKITGRVGGVVIMVCVLMFAGCGTFLSRAGHKPFGAYPYEAVCFDASYARHALHTDIDSQKMTENDWIAGPFIIVGDAALDTVLLPIDLLFWLFGAHKDHFSM